MSIRCAYSQRILNEFKKVELDFKNNKNLDFVQVTCDKLGNKKTCQAFEVRSYPQIGGFNRTAWVGIMPGRRGKAEEITQFIDDVILV